MSYHIQDVLKSVQGAAPAPRTTSDDIIAKAGRIRARRTATVLAGGVAACIALTATTVIGLRASGGGDMQQAAPPLPAVVQPAPATSTAARVSAGPPIQPTDFTTELGEYRVGAYKVGPAGQVAPGYQEIPVYRTGRNVQADDGTIYPLAVATITVYRPGVYDPTTFGGPGNATLVIGEPYPVKPGGRSGVGRDMTFISPVNWQTWVRASLAWEYAPHAWATLIPDYDTVALPRADALKIAAGLVTGRERELRVPYRLGFLPAGWRPVAVTQTGGTASSVVSKVFLHQGPLTESAATRIDEVFPHSALITVFKGRPKNMAERGTAPLHCYAGQASCDIIQGDYLIAVADWNGTLPDATIRQIAQGLQLRNPADQKTWLPLTP